MAESKLQSQMGSWEDGKRVGGFVWVSGWVSEGEVRRGGGGALQSQASVKPLPPSADMGNEKGGGCCLFSFLLLLLPSQSSNGQLQRHEKDKQTD